MTVTGWPGNRKSGDEWRGRSRDERVFRCDSSTRDVIVHRHRTMAAQGNGVRVSLFGSG
jgi:hypothetical protein